MAGPIDDPNVAAPAPGLFSFFANQQATSPGSYQAMLMRQRIAEKLAGQKHAYPKTFGEGLTYLGESLGEMNQMRLAEAASRAYDQQYAKDATQAVPTIQNSGAGKTSMLAPDDGEPPDAPTVPAVAATAPPVAPNTNSMAAVGDAIGRAEPNAVMREYYSHLAGKEDPSGGKRVSPTGAAGPFQFTRGTGKQYGLYGQDGTDNRTDVGASVKAVQQLTRDNAAAFIKINGRLPTLSELALMHQQGGVTGARMVAGTGNAPSRNLAVNNVDPNLGPQDAAAKIQGYYKMPGGTMPEGYHLGAGAESGSRDAVARAVLAQGDDADTAPEVPQANPTEGGPGPALLSATGPSTGQDGSEPGPVQVASLDPSIGVNSSAPTRAPDPTMGMNAVAPPEAANNPPIPTDIAPAPQVAQAGGRMNDAGPDRGIPGPLDAPIPVPEAPKVGANPQFQKEPVPPVPPTPAPITQEEIAARRMLLAHPGDPNYKMLAEQIAAPGIERRTMQNTIAAEQYKADLGRWSTLNLDYQKTLLPEQQLKQKEAEDKFDLQQRQQARFGSLGVEHFKKEIVESAKRVEALPSATSAIVAARNVLENDPSMFTGGQADKKLAMAKLYAAVGGTPNPKIVPTEQFKSFITPILAQMRSAVVGTGSQSEKELQTLEKAVGSDINLERGSIQGIINQVERINLAIATQHQKKLETFVGNDPNDRRVVYNSYGLPMEDIVPRSAISLLQKERNDPSSLKEFDERFHTPGLALKILSR